MILIILFISSFELSKVDPFPALAAHFPLIFLSNLFLVFEIELLTNPGQLSLSKWIAMFVGAFFPKLPNQEPTDSPDWISLDVWALLNFISVNTLLARAFLISVVCLIFRNNSCGNSFSSKLFLFNLNIVPVLFSAKDFNLFNYVLISLTQYLLKPRTSQNEPKPLETTRKTAKRSETTQTFKIVEIWNFLIAFFFQILSPNAHMLIFVL